VPGITATEAAAPTHRDAAREQRMESTPREEAGSRDLQLRKDDVRIVVQLHCFADASWDIFLHFWQPHF
jgi:hypothetical protein